MKPSGVPGLCLAVLILCPKPANAQAPGNFREIFAQLDANGDRVIDPNEVPEEGRQAFKRLLRRADSNENGKLEAEEFRDLGEQLREALTSNPANAEALRQRLARMDKNGDGKIDRKEFSGPQKFFDRLDRDGDGVLTPDDRGDGPAKPAGATPLPAAVRRLDKNGNGKIERGEFPGRPAVFSRLDRNNDGVLSAGELKNGLGGPGPNAAGTAKKPNRKP